MIGGLELKAAYDRACERQARAVGLTAEDADHAENVILTGDTYEDQVQALGAMFHGFEIDPHWISEMVSQLARSMRDTDAREEVSRDESTRSGIVIGMLIGLELQAEIEASA